MARQLPTLPNATPTNDSRVTGLNESNQVRNFPFSSISTYIIGQTDARYARTSHTHTGADITDLETRVDASPAVLLNTAKTSFPGFGTTTGQVENWAQTGNNTVIPTAKVSDAVIASITNQTISPQRINIGDTLTVASDVTLGTSSGTLDNFLQSIEDAGGRQEVILRRGARGFSNPSDLANNEVALIQDDVNLGTFNNILALGTTGTPSTVNISAALGNYYLIIVDNTDFYVLESATSIVTSLSGVYYATSVFASIGGYADRQTASIYSSANGIDVRDFLDFFVTNTPNDVLVPWSDNIGRTITDAQGETERVVGGGFSASGVLPLFRFAIEANSFQIGDIVRIRIWADDVDQATTVPIIDVRKQLFGVGSGVSLGVDLGTSTSWANTVFTTEGIQSLAANAIETDSSGANPIYYFATDQVRIDRSAQVQAAGLRNPANISVDGRTTTTELQAEAQVIFNGLPTQASNIPNKIYTQTGAQLGLTGAAATLKFVIQE